MLFRKKPKEGEWSVEKMLVEIDNNLSVAQDNVDAIHEALNSDEKKWYMQIKSGAAISCDLALTHQADVCLNA